MPLDFSVSLTPDRYFFDVLADPLAGTAVTIDASSTTTSLKGTVPEKLATVTAPVVLDVYLADGFGLTLADASYPKGFVQGRVLLGSYQVDGPSDTNPAANAFTFDVTALNLTATELPTVTATANYTLTDGTVVTSNFADPTGTFTAPGPLALPVINGNGTNLNIGWSGGVSPFLVQSATTTAGPWAELVTTYAHTITTPQNGPRRFYRVREGARPR